MALIDKPGGIVFASGDLARYAAFEDSLIGTKKPPGTYIARGYASDLTSNLNVGIEACLKAVPDLGWIWILADDHDWHWSALERLLAHDLDVVSPLVIVRRMPFNPSLYLRERDPETGLFQQFALAGLPRDVDLIVSGENAPEFYASPAGMVLSRKALDAVGPPWFEAGKFDSGYINEDMWLNEKLIRAGFKPAVDLTVRMGHITPVSVWPTLTKEGWKLDLRFQPYDMEEMK